MAVKTHKGLKKRLKKTKSGKLLHRKTGKSHLMAHKSGAKSLHLRQWKELSKSQYKAIRRQFGPV